MSDDPWGQMAAWRDERMGEAGDLWHRAIIDPELRAVVGPVTGLRILDLGCGNGYLARRFAAEGARRVVGIDASRATLARARARERADPRGVRFEVADAAHLNGHASESFDLVVANMAIMDIEDAAGTLGEVARLLAPSGRLVFSLCHPCFDTDLDSKWEIEHVLSQKGRGRVTIWRKVTGYRQEGRYSVPWDVSGRRTVWTPTYRRTLATYSRLLREAGFAITRLEEPMPLAEALEKSPQGPYIAEIPLHLIVEAVLVRPRPRRGSPSWARSRARASRRSGSARRRRDTGSPHRGSTAGS